MEKKRVENVFASNKPIDGKVDASTQADSPKGKIKMMIILLDDKFTK